MNKPRVLFSIPTRHHVEIAIDELTGLQDNDFKCDSFPYAAKEGYSSTLGRLWVIIQNAYGLIKKAKSFAPDIVYFNSRIEKKAGVRDFITILIFRTFYFKKVLILLKSHGSDLEVLYSKNFLLNKIVFPYLRNNIDGWLLLSSEEKERVISTGLFESAKIFTTQNVVRIDQFEKDPKFKERLNIPDDHTILLFVGRIVKEKGIYEVVEAFDQIKDLHKVTLIIVGDGDQFENIKTLIKAKNISRQVILTGFIPEKNVVAFYANGDILVFPTYANEGFPMALFNSVAAGMSIVTTRIRAATDFLSEPENCIWVKPGDTNGICTALLNILQSENLRNQMRINNMEKGKLFSKEYVSMGLVKIIKKVRNY